jgi:hypothetical protein
MYRILIIVLLLLVPQKAEPWGFYAHKKINEIAVYLLPPKLFEIYRPHIDYLIEHATDPDKRRYMDPKEGVRHYLDGEAWKPLDSLPQRWDKAVEKYTIDSLQLHGILPWHLQLMSYRLTRAFEALDLNKVLYLSAEIGHYVGDLHVPLHTTRNYNGQLTGQTGIHGLWESRIPELFLDKMDLFNTQAVYLKSTQKAIWDAYYESHSKVDSVLLIELHLRQRFDENQIMGSEERGNIVKSNFSVRYSRQYQQLMNGMVNRRLRESIHFLGSLWFTCWVNAGQPTMNLFEANRQLSDSTDSDSSTVFRPGFLRILGREEPSH